MRAILTSLILLMLFSAHAQQTGNFQVSVAFPQADYNYTRTLYYSVPSDYDASQAYKLVVGFRGGPHSNAGQFRDQLQFLSDSIGAIILCPENSDHFWNNEGLTKRLFNYSVDTTLSLYNIDTNFIYLTGLSYGGRHSVIVSMDTDDGAIPNIRGVIPFAAGSDSHLQPNYTDISNFPPACICIGLSDNQNFIDVSNSLHDDIQLNLGNSILNEIPAVGHTVDFPTYPIEMMECINYIESTYSTAEIKESALPKFEVYPNPVDAVLHIEALSDEQLKSISISNAAGKILLKKSSNFGFIDISSIPSGTYVLTLESTEASTIQNIVIY